MKTTKINKMPTSSSFDVLVENLNYRCLTMDEIPIEISSNNKITSKWNCAVIIASGSHEGMCYAMVGFRPDNRGTVVDEDPLIFYYHYNDESLNFGIQIHHGNWNERTYNLTPNQITQLANCGQTIDLQIKNLPQRTSGSLAYLSDSGSYVGYNEMFKIMLDEKQKSQNDFGT